MKPVLIFEECTEEISTTTSQEGFILKFSIFSTVVADSVSVQI